MFWFILTLFIFAVKAVEDEELFTFNNDQKILSECIEYNLSIDDDSYNKDPEITKSIAKLIAKRFRGKTLNKTVLYKKTVNMYHDLRKRKVPPFPNYQIYELRALREALVYCAEDGVKPDDTVFVGEQRELTNVLNYILVDWPFSFEEIIHSRKGRMILRSFAEEAQVALENALNYLDDCSQFRDAIRETWTHRAQFYFDARNFQFPYFRHRYTIGRGLRIQNILNMTLAQNYLRPDPRILHLTIKKFLHTHTEDYSLEMNGERDIFAEYNRNGMTLPEYFLESHIDKFYRVLIFYLESQYCGIVTDRSDIYYNSLIPYEILRKDFQVMLYNDRVYLKIIKDTRECLGKVLEEVPNEIGLIISSPSIFKKYETLWLRARGIRNNTTITPRTSNPPKSRYRQKSAQSKKLKTHEHDSDCTIVSNFNSRHSGSRKNIAPNVNFKPWSVPDFSNEPLEIGFVLDYILVDWPLPLRDMIHTRNGRATLRRYAEDAIVPLENALNSVTSHEYFRHSLRSLWLLRAQRYYDGYDPEIPYIRHRYTIRHSYPHTYDDQKLLLRRNDLELHYRNPVVSQALVDKVLNIHNTNRSHYIDEHDFYSFYKQNGMTSSEYYVETHIDQFYRTLFFFMELELHGIKSDENDIWDGPIPYEVVPNFIQEIVYNDESYSKFLLLGRKRLEKVLNESQIEVRKNLSNAYIGEEDLFSTLNLLILNTIPSDKTMSATTRTYLSTLTFKSSTTPKYDHQLKRKGSVWRNNKGKHFLKRVKNTFSENCSDGDFESLVMKDSRGNKESCYHYYNYNVSNSAEQSSPKYQPQQLDTVNSFYGYVEGSDHILHFKGDPSTDNF